MAKRMAWELKAMGLLEGLVMMAMVVEMNWSKLEGKECIWKIFYPALILTTNKSRKDNLTT
jgi:hypothetical protein